MYKQFSIPKTSGTYADALEAYGVAFLIQELVTHLKVDSKVSILNRDKVWLVESSAEFDAEQFASLSNLTILKYLKKDINDSQVPQDIINYDYPVEKQNFENLRNQRKLIHENKELTKEEKKKNLDEIKNSEIHKAISAEFDIYREMVRNPYPAYKSLFNNLYNNRAHAGLLLKEILDYYQVKQKKLSRKERPYFITEKVTSQQLYSPNQGKGLNRTKADKLSMENLDGYWISETMKVYGAIQTMFCQYVKVGTGMDLKIYVPAIGRISSIKDFGTIIKIFKAGLKSISPVKLDISNLLRFSLTFLHETKEYQEIMANGNKSLKRYFLGFYSVYQKDLGQNRAVVNISFLETPAFVNLSQPGIWSDILEELEKIILRIEEQGNSINGLKTFRDFLSSGHLDNFFDFSFWYSQYIMSELSKDNRFLIPFRTNILNQIFQSMNNINLIEIINDKGFQAIAAAIRKSTISLQYTPKKQRQYEIQYGLAQTLEIKSRNKNDLVTFIGKFATAYNAETARKKENSLKGSDVGLAVRQTLKHEELTSFYTLLDKYSDQSQTIGAILGSYGFALNQKDKVNTSETEEDSTDNDKL